MPCVVAQHCLSGMPLWDMASWIVVAKVGIIGDLGSVLRVSVSNEVI